MKPDKLTKKDTLRFRLNRSRSVSGRLPRVMMSDDFGRSLRANAIPQSQRNIKNYYYPKLPLDIQPYINEWAGPSTSKKQIKKLNREIREQYKKNRNKKYKEMIASLPRFESRIKNNIGNIKVKIFDELRKRRRGLEWYIFTYLRLYYWPHGEIGRAYAAKNAYANIRALETMNFYSDVLVVEDFDEDYFQIVFDFHINRTTGNPQALFTIVPTSNLEEFRNISTEEKRKKCLYDGYIGNEDFQYDQETDGLFDEKDYIVDKMKVSTRPNGVFVHEFVDEFELVDHPEYIDELPMIAQEWLERYPNRPQNNDDFKSDPSIVSNELDMYVKYRKRY